MLLLSWRTLVGAVSSSLLAHALVEKSTFDVLDYIDPLIGTANGGHVFPGATLPFGMAKSVADTNGDNEGGFAHDSTLVTGFSHMHDDGTGGSPSMGNFPLFPQPNCPEDDLNNCQWQQSDRETKWTSPKARPGYFAVDLANGVHAEMTTTNHSALYRFKFGDESPSLGPVILVDLIDLPKSISQGSAFVDPSTGRFTGSGTFNPSFGVGQYNLHFCTDFKGAKVRDTGVWSGNHATAQRKSVISGYTESSGTFTRFEGPSSGTILARVGVSFISVDQACSNAEKEQPDFDFDGTVSAAEDAWRHKLNVISVDADGVSKELQEIFWSGAYRTMISPQDYTGENPLWESDEPYYDSYYCIWDSYRSIHPLLTLLDPLSQSRMVRSLVDIYRHEGFLPDCRMSLCKGYTQGGSNADVVIADAFLKKVVDVDWKTAYEAVVKDANVEPANWDLEGRGGLRSWKKVGYIPKDDFDPLGTGTETRSVSRTVEYAYNDFCIAEMAERMGHSEDHKRYTNSSLNWRNLFKADQQSSVNGKDTGFTGFLQPKLLDESWAYQNPTFCSPLNHFDSCYFGPGGHETYEGSCWLYTFYAPHDMGSLVNHLGGPKSFTDRLDFMHDADLLNIGDEQAFLPVYQYHYAGRPALSAKRAHYYIPSQFNTTISGLAGNDDSGAMGSFLVFSMLGIWPVPGQDVYLINPPFFKEVSLRNSITGKVATIRSRNFDPEYKSIYIQSAKRDGKPWSKNWISHDFFMHGGVLELELGDKESDWGTKIKDLPPSISPYKNFSTGSKHAAASAQVTGGKHAAASTQFTGSKQSAANTQFDKQLLGLVARAFGLSSPRK